MKNFNIGLLKVELKDRLSMKDFLRFIKVPLIGCCRFFQRHRSGVKIVASSGIHRRAMYSYLVFG